MSYRAASPRRRESMQTRHSTVFNWGRRGPYFQPSKAQVATGGRRGTTRAASSGRCRTARAAGARSGASAGGSDAPSFLASADLPAGEATPLAGETHKSSDHVEFLRILDGKHPKGDLIRIVPGDVSARTSAETRRCLATVRLQVEVEPVGRRPDGRGARRGHPPPGWGRQGKLVAGRYSSLVEESEKRASNANPGGSFLIPLQEAHRCFTVPSSSILFIGISFVGLWGTCQIR